MEQKFQQAKDKKQILRTNRIIIDPIIPQRTASTEIKGQLQSEIQGRAPIFPTELTPESNRGFATVCKSVID